MQSFSWVLVRFLYASTCISLNKYAYLPTNPLLFHPLFLRLVFKLQPSSINNTVTGCDWFVASFTLAFNSWSYFNFLFENSGSKYNSMCKSVCEGVCVHFSVRAATPHAISLPLIKFRFWHFWREFCFARMRAVQSLDVFAI